MVTVRAPYPAKMDEIHNQSIVSLDRPGDRDIANFNNRSGLVRSIRIRNNPATMIKALRRIGSGDVEARDVVLRDWCRPFDNSVKISGIPALQSSGYGKSVSWSTDGVYLAVGHQESPFLSLYKRNGDTFTKLSPPVSIPSDDVFGLAWSNHSKVLYTTSIDKTCRAYTKDSAGVLTLTASGINVFNPVPSEFIYKLVMTKDALYAAVQPLTVTNKVVVYKRNTATSVGYTAITAGNNINAAEPLPEAMAWSQDGVYLAIGNAQVSGPWLSIYKRVGDVFTKLSTPSTPPAYGVSSLAFSLDDAYLAIGEPNNNELRVYKRSGDSWDSVASVSTGDSNNPGQIKNITWTPDGKYVLITSTTAPYMLAYKFKNNTLTRIDCFGGATSRTVHNIEISPDGVYLACASGIAPFLEVYKSSLTPHEPPFIRADPTAPVIDYTLAVS